MKKGIKVLFIIFTLLIISAGCKKIATPNENAKKLFGEWKYLYDSGGFTDEGSRFTPDNSVEYTERGKYTLYKGIEKVIKDRFTIEMKGTTYGDPKIAIVYKNGGYDTFQVNNDTLYLSEAGYDGYNYVFIKK